MDFVRVLTSVEGAVYEVMVWLIQIPKTLLRITFQPNWAFSYLDSEWEKKPEDRFDEYLSPVLLWLFITVIPPIFLGVDFFSMASTTTTVGGGAKFQDKLALSAVLALVAPLANISVVQFLNKNPAKRSTLKRLFYSQCYALTPSTVVSAIFSIPLLLIQVLTLFTGRGPNPIFAILALLFVLPGIVLSFFYQANFFRLELKTDWVKASLYAVAAGVVSFIISLVITVLLVITLAVGAGTG